MVNVNVGDIIENERSDIVMDGVFGKNLETDFGEVNITPVNPNQVKLNETTIVRLHPVEELALNLQGKIEIEEKEIGSSLIQLTMTYNLRRKAIDILDNLVDQYNKEVIDNKRKLANNTNEFINDRLEKISSGLTDSAVGFFPDLDSSTEITPIISPLLSFIFTKRLSSGCHASSESGTGPVP